MNKYIPQFVSEKQLEVADISHLEDQQLALNERLANAKTLKMGSRVVKFFGSGVALVNTALAAEHPDTMHFTGIGAALALAAAGHFIEKYSEKTETVLDFNLASIDSEISHRYSSGDY